MKRRDFLAVTAAVAAQGLVGVGPALAADRTSRYKGVVFDAFVVFDPRPVWGRMETLFAGKGAALANAWRTRQFEYTWLLCMMHRYVDFWTVTRNALHFAALQVGVAMTPAQADDLMSGYRSLKCWPDAADGLRQLKARGLRLGLLSNFTPRMLGDATQSAGVAELFEHSISTDVVKSYKPDPATYALGPKTFGLDRREMVFAAFGGWDAIGAKTYGYSTCWVNRAGTPPEQLDAKPDATGPDFKCLLDFVLSKASA